MLLSLLSAPLHRNALEERQGERGETKMEDGEEILQNKQLLFYHFSVVYLLT
jgi:hypothetical protein